MGVELQNAVVVYALGRFEREKLLLKSLLVSLLLLVSSGKVLAAEPLQRGQSLSICKTALENIGGAPALDSWIKDLVRYYANPAQEVPASFKPESFWSRIKNEVFLRSFRINLLFYSTGISERDAGQLKDPSSEVRNILNQFDRSVFGWAMKGSIFNTMSRLTARNPSGPDLSSLGKTLVKMRAYHSEFKEDINAYKNLYGVEFFTPEVLARGTINTQTMKLFALVDKDKTIPSRDAANAIALLHPITDEALDKGKVSKETLKKLTNFLETQEPPTIETPYEHVLFGLLGYIYRDFPPAQHPLLFSMLKR